MTPLPSPSLTPNPVDWSQFWPNTLSTFITTAIVGALVGIFLWKWQKRSENNTIKRLSIAAWNTHREAIGSLINKPFDRAYIAQNLEATVAEISPVWETARTLPVSDWADAAPENKELLALRGLVIDGPKLLRLADEVTEALREGVRKIGVQVGSEAEFIRWGSVTVLEVDDPRKYLHIAYDHTAEMTKTLALPEVSTKVAEFRKELELVEALYAELRHSLLGL